MALPSRRTRRRLSVLFAVVTIVLVLARLALGPDSVHWIVIAVAAVAAVMNRLV